MDVALLKRSNGTKQLRCGRIRKLTTGQNTDGSALYITWKGLSVILGTVTTAVVALAAISSFVVKPILMEDIREVIQEELGPVKAQISELRLRILKLEREIK